MPKIVKGFGPMDAKLIVIGEAPGETEEQLSRPFMGAGGRFLRAKLSNVGINHEQVRYENLMEYRPPQNKFEFFLQGEKYVELQARVEELKALIKTINPNVVLCVGQQPLRFLMDKTSIGDWRGHFIWSQECDCKMIATYHPSACLRQRNVHKSQKPGQYEALFQADIAKVGRELGTKELKIPQYSLLVNPSFDEAMNEMEQLRTNAQILSFDIETVENRLTCIGFSATTNRACCIPVYNVQEGKLVTHWDESQAKAIWEQIIALVESDIPKVLQNSQYDITVLEHYYGIKTRNLYWDTLVAAHNLYCDLPKDLGTLISLYTNMPYHKYMIEAGSNLAYWEYNALDALTTLMIMQEERKELIEFKTLNHFLNVTMPLIPCLIKMQLTGVNVDLRLRDRAIDREDRYMTDIIEALHQVLPGFNPRSPMQCGKLFYDTLHCPVIRSKGKPTIGADALERIAERDERPYVKLLTDVVTKFRMSGHMAGVLRTPLLAGRMHTAYDAGGTDTGRLNSKESIFGTGTNLQNLQQGPQRQMLVPG